MPDRPLRLLLLFQGAWEDECVEALRRSRTVVLEREGFEPMSLRGFLRSRCMNVERYVDRLCRYYEGRIDAVWSTDDALGVLLAAVVARRLGLPGAEPRAVVTAQHKGMFRAALAASLPSASVRAEVLPWRDGRALRDARRLGDWIAARGLSWPLFCKPVRGSFSVRARRVDSPAQLAAHLRLPWVDRQLLTAVNRPFDRLASAISQLPCPSHCMLVEEPMAGAQVNVDGYVHGGAVHVLGVVDECMYPGDFGGARHFAGFTMPSRLPAAVQAEVRAVATAVVRAVGYDHGLFNVELFVGADGAVRVIELNPRGAGQFTALYRAVHGIDLELLAMQLAAGGSPEDLPRQPPRAAAGASFVFRRFDGRPGPAPDATARAWLAATHPQARLFVETGSARAVRSEYRWVGSHRHAVLNHTARDFATLFADGQECARRLFGVALPPL